MNRLTVSALALMLVAGVAAGADAQTKTVTVNMTEAHEVPPHQGSGAGTATLILDPATKSVSWKVTWQGLSSTAIMAHIHGPASPTANAGVQVNLASKDLKMGDPLPNPLEGKATLTDAQWTDLMAGKDYINVHTTNNKGGEIRGQIAPQM
ncbi:MAG TPA: CHRD domain-containing protein [Stellaceae bacterium]|nr:CHRD domain-containing protein [Stellaceae bacterium]